LVSSCTGFRKPTTRLGYGVAEDSVFMENPSPIEAASNAGFCGSSVGSFSRQVKGMKTTIGGARKMRKVTGERNTRG
jgi:hypothetical protein